MHPYSVTKADSLKAQSFKNHLLPKHFPGGGFPRKSGRPAKVSGLKKPTQHRRPNSAEILCTWMLRIFPRAGAVSCCHVVPSSTSFGVNLKCGLRNPAAVGTLYPEGSSAVAAASWVDPEWLSPVDAQAARLCMGECSQSS